MKKYSVKIKGLTPYMQHRMDDASLEAWEKSRGKIIERQDIAKPDLIRALFHSYQDEKGNFYIPSEQIRGSMINAGGLRKGKVGNAKRNMTNIVAAMFMLEPDKIFFKGKFEVDKRSAVNQNVKARVISIRPRFENWSAEFTLLIDNDTITDETARGILEDAGNYIGIGSFRPQKKGMFGRFIVEKFEKLNGA